MRISVGLALAAIVLAQSPQVTFAKSRVTAEVVALPTVSAAVPVTATSRPFLGAAATMAKAGYIEEELQNHLKDKGGRTRWRVSTYKKIK